METRSNLSKEGNMAKKKKKDEGLFDMMLAETMKEPEDEDIKFSEGGDIEDSAVAATSNRYRFGPVSRGAGGAFTGIKFSGVK
jgi:hypothetical protein